MSDRNENPGDNASEEKQPGTPEYVPVPPPLPHPESPEKTVPVKSPFFTAGRILVLLEALVLAVCCVYLGSLIGRVNERARIAVAHPLFQMDNEEGALLFQAMEIARGHQIYHDIQDAPYYAATYTPLYLWACSTQVDLDFPDFGSGRRLSWSSAWSLLAVIFMLIALRTRNIAAAVMAAFLYFGTFEVYQWIAYFRVDFLAILLSVTGLALLSTAPENRATHFVSALFLIAAVYTKQTMIAAPLACLVALLLRRKGLAFGFLVMLIGLGFVPMYVLSARSHDEFLRHIIWYNMNEIHPHDWVVWGRHVWRLHRWFLLAGCLSIVAMIAISIQGSKARKRRPDEWDSRWENPILEPCFWYAGFSLLDFAAIAKAGTAENYLIEPIAAWALLCGMTLGYCARLMWNKWPGGKCAAIFSLLIVGMLSVHTIRITSPTSQMTFFSPYRNPGPRDLQAASTVAAMVDEEHEQSFCELSIFNLLAHQKPVFQPFIMSELARQGKWDQGPFVKDLQNGEYSMLVTQEDVLHGEPTDIYTPQMIQAIRSRYEEADRINGHLWHYHILRLRDDDSTQPIDSLRVASR